jgi:hypothetical protein
MVPQVVSDGHKVYVHLSGTFTDTGWVTPKGLLLGDLVIDAGPDVTIVDDNSGSNYTATSSAVDSLTATGAGWTGKAYRGQWIEVLTGPAAGETRQIYDNTTDTITPAVDWSEDPGLADFRIVRPATTWNPGANFGAIDFQTSGPGTVYLQRLYVTGDFASIRGTRASSQIACPGLVINADWAFAMWFQNCTFLWLRDEFIEPTTGALQSATTGPRFGLSCLAGTARVDACEYVTCEGTYAKELVIYGTDISGIHQGSHLERLEIYGARMTLPTGLIKTSAGYATTRIGDSPDVGLTIKSSTIRVGNIVIGDNTTHGIEVIDSTLEFEGITTGTGNSGAGVYAHDGSRVLTDLGSAPTLAGTVGELSFDGSTQKATWATVNTTPQVEATSDLILAKAI